MSTIATYINVTYDKDVATYLIRLIDTLNVIYKGFDDQPLIDILNNGDTNLATDMTIRAHIEQTVRTTLAVYGVKLTTDEIPLEIWCAILNTINNASDVNTTMSYTDPVETLAHYVEMYSGISAVTVCTYLDEVHQTLVVAMGGNSAKVERLPNDLTNLKLFTDDHGTNIASALIDINVVPGLPVDYYMTLFGSQIRSDPKDMVTDIYSIMVLAELDAHDATREWLTTLNLDGSARNKAMKYLSELR